VRYFIRTLGPGVFEHPITEDNLRLIYPNMDFDNPPNGLAHFNRLPTPTITDTQMVEPHYVLSSDGVTWEDAWTVREMTAEELALKNQ